MTAHRKTLAMRSFRRAAVIWRRRYVKTLSVSLSLFMNALLTLRIYQQQMQGSKKESQEGNLVIMAAGDRGLYDECTSCFDAMGTQCFYLGDVGVASKMYMILQMISGVSLAVLGEAMALGKCH